MAYHVSDASLDGCHLQKIILQTWYDPKQILSSICRGRPKPPGNPTEGNDLRPSPIYGTLRLHNYETNYTYKICIYFRSVFLDNSANRCNCMNLRLASMFLCCRTDCSHIHCTLKHETYFTYTVKAGNTTLFTAIQLYSIYRQQLIHHN